MKVKDFFKSVSFKCIAVLLGIVLVCGIFLTAMNTVLYVSDQEKLDRAIAKIYGAGAKVEEQQVDASVTLPNAQIASVYSVDDGNYLIKSTGLGGYSGGSVTCWVVVRMNKGNIAGVGKVVLDGYTAQTQMADVAAGGLYDKYAQATYTDDLVFTTDDSQYKVVGSTKSSNAVNNAVNGALDYVKIVYLGQDVGPDPLEGFEYRDQIDSAEYALEGTTLTYSIKTKGLTPNAYDITVAVDCTTKSISEYTITTKGSYPGDKDYPALEYGDNFATYLVGKTAQDILTIYNNNVSLDTLKTYEEGGDTIFAGATESNHLCLNAALFAVANVDKALEKAYTYTENVKSATASVAEGVVTFTIETTSLTPNAYTVSVSVDCATNAITAYSITTKGSYPGDKDYPALEYGDNFATYLVGKTAEDILTIFDNNVSLGTLQKYEEDSNTIFAGATESNFLCLYAALYATANAPIATLIYGGNN